MTTNNRQKKKQIEDRIKFVIEFTQTDLDSLRKGSLINLIDDIKTFIRGERGYPPHLESLMAEKSDLKKIVKEYYFMFNFPEGYFLIPDDPKAEELDLKSIKELQELARTLLYQAITPDIGATIPLNINVGIYLQSDGVLSEVPSFGFSGEIRSLFIFRIVQCFLPDKLSCIQKCSMCKRIFYKTGKKQYCSLKCTYRAINLRRKSE